MKSIVKEREIKYIWHFARLKNLGSILHHGLIGRSTLERWAEPPEFNDSYRLDRQKDAVCCSIGHPNYKMFYSLRMNNPAEEWVVIACKPDILWEKECAFCTENAASNNVACIPIEQRKNKKAFERMFEEVDGIPSRAEIGLGNDCPTNPQAEILVFGNIEPKYIIGAICPTKAIEIRLKNQFPDFDFLYHRSFYSPRKDYKHWQ